MSKQSEKYDVAISFLSEDESLATSLQDELSALFEVFVYSKQQEKVAGTDGLSSFREVFRHSARLNVVLFRYGWGETRWTRIEQTAIQECCLDKGWDHLLFVSLEDGLKAPDWVPDTEIRLNYPVYGFEELIGVIKSRATRVGSVIRKETAVDRAKRVAANLEFQQKRELLLTSEDGVKSADAEAEKLFIEISTLVDQISAEDSGRLLQVGYKNQSCMIRSRNFSLSILWRHRYSNTLSGAQLIIRQFEGQLILPTDQNRMSIEEPRELRRTIYEPDFSKVHGWCWSGSDRKPLTTTEVADQALKQLLSLIDKNAGGKSVGNL